MFKNFVKKQAESENAIKEFNAIDDIERPYDPELDTIEYLRSLDKKGIREDYPQNRDLSRGGRSSSKAR